MKTHCLILDDEPLARKVIREYLDQLPDFSVMAECQDALEAHRQLMQGPIDLMFVDISLPGLSGMQFLKSITNPPVVIFTTAYSEYAVEAFEVNAFDYLVKPITFERFVISIQKVRTYLGQKAEGHFSENSWINVKEGRRIYHLHTSDIIYLQAYGDYIRIFTRQQTIMTKEKLAVFKEQLPANFIQVHRSYIVNRQAIRFVEGNTVQLEEYQIPVSDTYRNHLLDLLSK